MYINFYIKMDLWNNIDVVMFFLREVVVYLSIVGYGVNGFFNFIICIKVVGVIVIIVI